jgi:hypothetical protein
MISFNPLRFLPAFLVLVLGIFAARVSVYAARPYVDGDILVGFRATSGMGAGTSYLVNIGPATQFTNAASVVAVDLGSTALADLVELYGADWHARPEMRWSLSGVQSSNGGFPAFTLFASRAEETPGIKSLSWNRATAATQQVPAGRIAAMAAAYASGAGTSGQVESGTLGLRQPVGTANSYDANMPGGTRASSFEFYQSGSLGIEQAFTNGAINAVLDFYKMEPRPVGATLPGALVGAFRISSNAELTFSPTVAAFAVPVVSFSAAVATVSEDVSSGKILLTLQRSGVTNTALDVHFSTINGTALAGADFVGKTNAAVPFAANQLSQTVEVEIIDVPGFIGNRVFKCTISVVAEQGFAGAPREMEITILETDTQPSVITLSEASYAVSETQGAVDIHIDRTGFTGAPATVLLNTVNGTAAGGVDFTTQSNRLVEFAVNETRKTVAIPITNRSGFVGARAFSVQLSNGTDGASVGTPGLAVVTIGESDPQPAIMSLTSDSFVVDEDDGFVAVAIVRAGSMAPVSVTFDTVDFTAIAGTDFVPQTGVQLDFAEGETSRTVNVAITNRAGFGMSRQFGVQLSAATGVGEIGTPNIAIVTINDVDPNPVGRFSFTSPTYKYATRNSGGRANTVVATIQRTVGDRGRASVEVSLVLNGYPSDGVVTASSLNVTFAEGERMKDVVIPLTAKAVPGSFSLAMSNPTNGATVVAPGVATFVVSAPDVKMPVVKLISPKAGKVGASFDVAGSVADDDAIDRVEVVLNGVRHFAEVTGKNFALRDLAPENGPNTITVVAFDESGTGSKPVSVTVQFADPSVAVNAGNYTGLLSPSGATPPGGNKLNASGAIGLKVTKTGAFTGKIAIGGAVVSLKGTLGSAGNGRMGVANALFVKSLSLGELRFSIRDGRLSGNLGEAASLDGDRAFYDGKTNAVSPELLSANKGKFTAVFPAKPQAAFNPAQFPQGDGVVFLTLNSRGNTRVAGVLADGTKFSASGALSEANRVIIHAQLYGKKGSLGGALTFDAGAADTDLAGVDFLWLRPALTSGTHYLAGWRDGLRMDVSGARYVVPGRSENRSVFPFSSGSGSATVTFADGKLDAPVFKNVVISSANLVTNLPDSSDRLYQMSIQTVTGAIEGSFRHTDGSKTKFTAAIIQKGGSRGAYGFFLSTVLKNALAGEGGGVTITAD